MRADRRLLIGHDSIPLEDFLASSASQIYRLTLARTPGGGGSGHGD